MNQFWFVKKHPLNGYFPFRNEQGAVMIYLISVILIMSTLGAAMLNLTSTSTIGQVSANHMERACYMAEAGCQYALPLVKDDIASDGTYDDIHAINHQTFILDNGNGKEDGRFQIRVDDTDPDSVLITAIGSISGGVSTDVAAKLTCQLARVSGGRPLFTSPLFSGNSLKINQNAYIDGDVGTNGPAIVKGKGVTITGDEETGVGKTLDPVPFACDTCDVNRTIQQDITLTSTTERFKNLTVKKGTTIDIIGDVVLYVRNSLTMNQKSSFKLAEGASLTIYVDQKANFKNNFSVDFGGSPARPEDFVVIGTVNADSISIGSHSTFVGSVYAPGANIIARPNSRITGALIGDRISIGQSALVTWDQDVASILAPAGGVGSPGTPSGFFDSVQYFSQ